MSTLEGCNVRLLGRIEGVGAWKLAQTDATTQAEEPTWRPGRARRRWLVGIAIVVGMLLVAVAITVEYIASHAGPLLKSSVVATLAARFHSPVELDSLDITVLNGLAVHGHGLRILYLAGPTQPDIAQDRGQAAAPMLSVNSFSFRTTLGEVLHLRANVARVDVDGMELHIPPHEGGQMPETKPPKSRIALTVAKIYCKNVKLVIETTTPGKDPLQFNIPRMELTDVGAGRPLLYVADVVNPRPVGMVHAAGHFGPWRGDNPRSTALDGRYAFDNVALDSIKGLRGVLSSTGTFQGRLGHLTVDGASSTPEFALDVSDHPMPLNTTFHAFVDGTTGDTTLNSVEAMLGQSRFSCTGGILRVPGKGHDIVLSVTMPQGRIEDILQLVMKTTPALMRGAVTLQAKLHIPPGNVRVAEKLLLAGNLRIQNVEFTSAKLQDQVNSLSLRAQGKPGDAKATAGETRPAVLSEMAATFSLANAMLMIRSLDYQLPGAKVKLVGIYPLDGSAFDFRGHVRTDATASEMLTGWKSLLVKPFDGLLQKGGKGADIPVEIRGSHGNFNIGFSMHGADETPEQILADMKAQNVARQQSQPH